MNKFIKPISVSLILMMMFSITTSAYAFNDDYESNEDHVIGQKIFDDSWKSDLEFYIPRDIPQELLDPNYYSEDEIIYIPEEYLDPNHPDTLYTTYDAYGNSNGERIQVRAIAAAAGVYLIPGIGQIAITATGAVIVGGLAIKGGSYLYNKISAYFSEKTAKKAAEEIPKSVKSSDMKVDLSKFKDKNGNTPAEKSSGTFTSGKWVITKDISGHIGYNGNKKAWKIGNPARKASLDKSGNIIDK
ncbi:hypothetical protein FQ087_03710 [Sporosarcina sp. ANT_H38]|uniref:hypothetical protein n=1 Tax=Sporosarcina sp. ANT_H38 TaxID=2597358 RepID=UPI0011F2A860|nr:hypothetical protein [Sporosarcina sp. ANT_H38]KAA0965424.1 hypothetical protein FQ087_03710 [Sporosarcina sp. ANT_H38]